MGVERPFVGSLELDALPGFLVVFALSSFAEKNNLENSSHGVCYLTTRCDTVIPYFVFAAVCSPALYT